MLEGEYQLKIKRKINALLPGVIILKNDPNYIQGIPDLLILYKRKWASLEVKTSKNAKHRPNQDYYIKLMSTMSFSSFIYPENENQVILNLIKYLDIEKYNILIGK